MELKILPQAFSVCKLTDCTDVNLNDEFCFFAKTDEEFSLVCEGSRVPLNAVECESGWRSFRIQGVLDFSLIGILSKISTILAENGIGIFAVSTFNTDYIFTKAEQFDRALELLRLAGYVVHD
ncbi:MAG: ACT domain-containing protein [Clostridiaceae bacterium]